MSRPKKYFKIQFKQDGQLWELQEIPLDRLAAANLYRIEGGCTSWSIDGVECSACPFDRRLYAGASDCSRDIIRLAKVDGLYKIIE